MTTDSDESRPPSDDDFEPVCSLDEVPEVRPKKVVVDGRGILLCRSGGEIRAVDEICPHEKRSMRYGVVQRGRIVCPHHRYKFDLETGRCRQRCAPAQLYEVRVEDGTVFVRVPTRDD